MSEWKARRFWSEVAVVEAGEGFSVALDGRPVRTPLKSKLVLPTHSFAEKIAAEWEAQEEVVNPLSMPFTRSANSALDRVRPNRDKIISSVVSYGETDLLCYRATAPEALVSRQSAAWDPLLDWAKKRFGVAFVATSGVVPIDQGKNVIETLTPEIRDMSNFELTGFHDLVSLSGSLVIGLAAVNEVDSIDRLWHVSRIDEDWQAEQWGEDEEASLVADRKREEFLHAVTVFALSKD